MSTKPPRHWNAVPRALRQIIRGSPRGIMELDKTDGFWVVTSFLAEDVILRLRAAYESYEDECRLFFDARMRGEREFRMLGTVDTHVTTLWNEDAEYRLHMDDLPQIWTAH